MWFEHLHDSLASFKARTEIFEKSQVDVNDMSKEDLEDAVAQWQEVQDTNDSRIVAMIQSCLAV